MTAVEGRDAPERAASHGRSSVWLSDWGEEGFCTVRNVEFLVASRWESGIWEQGRREGRGGQEPPDGGDLWTTWGRCSGDFLVGTA